VSTWNRNPQVKKEPELNTGSSSATRGVERPIWALEPVI